MGVPDVIRQIRLEPLRDRTDGKFTITITITHADSLCTLHNGSINT